MSDSNQTEPGYSKKMVWLIVLLIVLAGIGLVLAIWPKNTELRDIVYPQNPAVNNNSNPNNTNNGSNQTPENNNQTPGGNGNNAGGTTTPVLDPIRDVTTTTATTTNPGLDTPPDEVNPNTGNNNPPTGGGSPGTVNPNPTTTTPPPSTDAPPGGVRP